MSKNAANEITAEASYTTYPEDRDGKTNPAENRSTVQRNKPCHGEIWRHFKGKLYKIIECPVQHTETNEKLVVYQALYGNYGIYARPLEMFMSRVDKRKYPDVKQRYRFELVEPAENN